MFAFVHFSGILINACSGNRVKNFGFYVAVTGEKNSGLGAIFIQVVK